MQQPDRIEFGPDVSIDLERSLKREWLETNGLGGFASSTIVGCNTRRYHGLLTAATKPPVGRLVLLSKLEETLILDGRRFDLSVNRYPGAVHPQGHRYLASFRLDPFPVLTYSVEGVEIEKSVFMVQGENTTVVQYAVRGLGARAASRECSLELRPLIAFRDYHSLTHENSGLNAHVAIESGVASVTPYEGLPALHFAHDADEINPTGQWYRNFEYDVERERGLDCSEDLFNPFVARFDLQKRSGATVIASLEPRNVRHAPTLRDAEIARRAKVASASPREEPFVRALVASADQFIVARGDQKTVIAGYHWFSDWGRDTMIALPGLTLATGRAEIAKSILLAFAAHVDRGMLPNRFPDAGEAPEYNTVDATLWFFEAIRALAASTGDYEFVRTNFYKVLADIIDWHVRGTRYGIRLDSDGLLASGEPGVQLTWMDAKVGDWVVTPRHGKAVEIQALWYNALRIMEDFAGRFGDDSAGRRYGEMAARAEAAFDAQFWNEEAACLYDVVSDDARDGSIRPNQIFALSLAHPLVTGEKARRVLDVVERELLTPYGLRSLSPRDPQYRGRYEGGPWSRDGAYHQGTVWPWLMGPFITAYVRAHGGTAEARSRAAQWLRPLEEHLRDAGLGQISEIFDGDPPHYPCGCIAQAWSVAELLRACVEDVFVSPRAAKRTVRREARPADRIIVGTR
jgi:predicted glycogen debranching enzyme